LGATRKNVALPCAERILNASHGENPG
jgi:hypothetical protein